MQFADSGIFSHNFLAEVFKRSLMKPLIQESLNYSNSNGTELAPLNIVECYKVSFVSDAFLLQNYFEILRH